MNLNLLATSRAVAILTEVTSNLTVTTAEQMRSIYTIIERVRCK